MKRLHLRFYPYISAIVSVAILTFAMLSISVFLFISLEIGMGICATLLAIAFNLCLWLILQGGIVINFKKNRLKICPRGKNGVFAIDKVKEICISFRFDKKYKRWSANITVYLKNGKSEIFSFAPYEWRFSKYGIPLHNKNRIELKAKECNLIRCYTVK